MAEEPNVRKKAVRKEYEPAKLTEEEWDALAEALKQPLSGRPNDPEHVTKMLQVVAALRNCNNEPTLAVELKLEEFPGQTFISEQLAKAKSPLRLVQIGTLPPSHRGRKVAFARVTK